MAWQRPDVLRPYIMNKNWMIVLLIAASLYFYWKNDRETPKERTPVRARAQVQSTPQTAPTLSPSSALPQLATTKALAPASAPQLQEISKNPENSRRKDVAKFVLDEGLAVIQGDLVVGVPTEENPDDAGLVLLPKIDPWRSNVIPYYIQPTVKNPERVLQALELFRGTAIQFVPYTDQQDVLVFEDSSGICKSYVGRIGGKQPIWIPPGCEAAEVAHEIMHALGFVHEQNRADRDQFIQVLDDAIKEEFKNNFDLLPASMMKLSGLESFDFESLMMYPPTMFAKSSAPTMVSKIPSREIRPSEFLSPKDRVRINKAFGP